MRRTPTAFRKPTMPIPPASPSLTYLGSWNALSPEVRGIALMCLSTIGFAVMHVAIQYATAELHPMLIAFFRNFFGLLVFLPLLISGGTGFLRTKRLMLHGFRGVLNIGAMFMFFYALGIAELAHITALAFSAPIFAGVLSVIVLGEQFHMRRWIAILVGFGGVLVILRPGIIPIDLGSVLVLGAAFLWAIVMIIIKVMSRTESSMTIVAYMNIFLALYSVGPAIWFWQWPSLGGWILMIGIGVSGTLAQMALSQSLKETDPTLVMPFDFLRLIWVAVLGALIFGQIPETYVWIGGAIVFAAGFYLAYRENQKRLNIEKVFD